jgi:2-methylaconitate cis-trans-isomerase PrpF
MGPLAIKKRLGNPALERNEVRTELDNCVQVLKTRHAGQPALLEVDIFELRRAANRLEHEMRLSGQRRAGFHQLSIPAGYYRGGTSRAVILQTRHLPKDKDELHDAYRQIIGSNDRHGRQLNGMGAGISSLSKICLVEPAHGREDVDILYTFVGMGIEGDEVDLNGNCGNMAAAIGPFVYNERLSINPKVYGKENRNRHSREKPVTINILNTNTNVIIRSTFIVSKGQAWVDDSTSIDGVSGMGTGVTLDFLRPGGSKTGKLLPTGNAVDVINGINVSCVDAANPCVFVKASDLDIDPTILPARFLGSPFKLQKLEDIRAEAAVLMGLCKPGDTPPRVIPKIGIVSPPVEQHVLSKDVNSADSLDLVVRFISDGQPHRAIPLTAALCTAAAAKIPGSIVQQCVRETPVSDGVITIGHPSGRIQVNATMDDKGDIECCTVIRTARRISKFALLILTVYNSGTKTDKHSVRKCFLHTKAC